MQPTLTTPRLLLRPAAPPDLEALWRLWTDPDVRRFLWDDRVITRGEAAETLENCQRLSSEGLGLWMIEPRPAAEAASDPLGCAALLPVSTAAEYEPRLLGMLEPLVSLDRPVWGRGYAREALERLLEHAAATLRRSSVAAVTDLPNDRSDRMLRAVGFVPLSETDGPRHRLRTYLWQRSALRPMSAHGT